MAAEAKKPAAAWEVTMKEKRCLCYSVDGLAGAFHNMVYYDWNETSDKVLFIVHGLTRNGRDFDRLAKHMATTLGYRVICPDVPGRGKSDSYRSVAQYATLHQYLADLTVLINTVLRDAAATPRSIDWIGSSMGGNIGMAMAGICSYVEDTGSYNTLEECTAALKERYQKGWGPDMTDELWKEFTPHSFKYNEATKTYSFAFDAKLGEAFVANHKKFPQDLDLFPHIWAKIPRDLPVLVLHGKESTLLTDQACARMIKEGHEGGHGGPVDVTVHHYDKIGHLPPLVGGKDTADVTAWFIEQDKKLAAAQAQAAQPAAAAAKKH